MSKLVLFNKPFDVLSQFTSSGSSQTLASYIPIAGVYPAGRLDKDSEGLLLLTDDGKLQQRISDPQFKLEKTYLVQVEGLIDETALTRLRQGILLNDGPTKPAIVKTIPAPDLWPRNPPVRFRANIPTSWIEMTISEGRNRQVRRMTAASGFPTLRLVRWRIGDWTVEKLLPGEYSVIELSVDATPGKPARRNRHR